MSIDWTPGGPEFGWKTDIPWTEWTVGFSSTAISHLSTEYLLVPVSAVKNGSPYNPTGDTVQFAFMPAPTQVPQNTDWVAGAWDTDSGNLIYPYSAKCLIGPSGIISLGLGTYTIYVKITDNPETPVLIGGQLTVM